MAPFETSGTLTTDKRTVNDTTTWDTQTEWEAYQSKDGIEINNGVLELAQLSVVDSAVARWAATNYDEVNDVWVDDVGGFDLTGGSATLLSGSGFNGNTTVEYDGSTGQGHNNTSISFPYGNVVVAIVMQLSQANTNNIIYGDDSYGSVHFQNDSGGTWDLQFGSGGVSAASPDTNAHLFINYGANFSGDDEIEQDGSTIATGDSGSNGFSNGFILGDRADQDLPQAMQVAETVIYQNPTQTEIDNERQRLSTEYGITLS